MTPSRLSFCVLLAALALQDGGLRPSPLTQNQLHAQQKPVSSDQRPISSDLKAQAEAFRKQGRAAWDRGDIQEALVSFQTSLDFWQKHGADKPDHANTLAELGEVFLEIGQPQKALDEFGKALELLNEQDDRDARFEVVNGAGMAHLDLKNTELASAFYQKALEVATNPEDKALALHRIGTAYRIRKDLPSAAVALKESREFAKRAKNRQIEGYALAELAHLDDLNGREEEALRGFEQARQIFQDLGLDSYVASTLLGTAEVQRELGRLDEAVASIETSIRLMELIRADLEAPGDRVGFFAARHRYYEFLVQLLMEQARRKPGMGYAVKAFEQSERAKARSLLDHMAGKSGFMPEGMTLREIQGELLDKDSVLLTYVLGDRGSFLWVVSRDGITVHELPERDRVEEAARRAWRELSEGSGTVEVQRLSRMLLPAGIGPLTGKRLLVSLDGLLHLVPFTLLRQDGDRMLFLDHEIVHIPSASVVVGMRRKLAGRPPAPMRFAGLGDPVFQSVDSRLGGRSEPAGPRARGALENLIGDLKRLRFTRAEVRSIFKLFPEGGRLSAFDFEANRSVLPKLSRFQILHFATHHVAGEHPSLTGLVLSLYDEKGRPQPGFVTAPEIYGLDLPAELVVLSACGTGLGRDVRGEGPVGLSRAFLHAGAKRVVVSLWSVKDKATAELMKRFYERMLDEDRSPAEALVEAQRSMYDEPKWRSAYRSWGAFVLQGEPR